MDQNTLGSNTLVAKPAADREKTDKNSVPRGGGDCVAVWYRSFDHVLCGKRRKAMGTGRANEFYKDALRIALTSGLSRRLVTKGGQLQAA